MHKSSINNIDDLLPPASPALAVINEAECIGCTKCIQACPFDAIMGAAKFMHTVLTQECTGCGLCVEPCPVDCIDLTPLDKQQYQPEIARRRFLAKQDRLANTQLKASQPAIHNRIESDDEKLSYIATALKRVQSKK